MSGGGSRSAHVSKTNARVSYIGPSFLSDIYSYKSYQIVAWGGKNTTPVFDTIPKLDVKSCYLRFK